MNEWISVATAAVSAAAVLLGTLLTNVHTRSIKRLEVATEKDLRRADRRREAGEEAYTALQVLAKLYSEMATIALSILDREVDPEKALSRMAEISNETLKVDAIGLRLKLETYFPEAHQAWTSFDKLLSKTIDLNACIRDNLIEILEAFHKGKPLSFAYDEYKLLPETMRKTMHGVCRIIVDKIDEK